MATTSRNFRLSDDVISQIDEIKEFLARDGQTSSRTDAIRVAVLAYVLKIPPKKSRRKPRTRIDTVPTGR